MAEVIYVVTLIDIELNMTLIDIELDLGRGHIFNFDLDICRGHIFGLDLELGYSYIFDNFDIAGRHIIYFNRELDLEEVAYRQYKS